MPESQNQAIDFFSSNFFKEFKIAIVNSAAIPGIRSLNSKVNDFKNAKPMSRIVKNNPSTTLGRSSNVKATPKFNKNEVDKVMESYKDKLIDSAIYCIVFLTEEHIENFNLIADGWDDYMRAKLDQANVPNANLADIVLKFKDNINFIFDNYDKSHPNPVAEPEESESEESESSEAGDDTPPSEESTTPGDGTTSPGEGVDEDEDKPSNEEPGQEQSTTIAPPQQQQRQELLDAGGFFKKYAGIVNKDYEGFDTFYDSFLGDGLKENGYLLKLNTGSLLFVETKAKTSNGVTTEANIEIILQKRKDSFKLSYASGKKLITKGYNIINKQWGTVGNALKEAISSSIADLYPGLEGANKKNITYRLTNINTDQKAKIIEKINKSNKNKYYTDLRNKISLIDTTAIELTEISNHYIRGSLSSVLFESIDLKKEWRKIWEV